MKSDFLCISCILKQLSKDFEMFKINTQDQKEIMRLALRKLQECDYDVTPVELSMIRYDIINKFLNCNDPYRNLKKQHNEEVLKISEEILEIINNSGNPMKEAMKIAIIGNLMDFGTDIKSVGGINLLKRIKTIEKVPFEKDERNLLLERLKSAKTLLYMGDNCGEIVLDKILIRKIKDKYPQLRIAFGVRGEPIVNDATAIEAKEIGMEELAHVISNGQRLPGLVLHKASEMFKTVYEEADLVIMKGQGNFEAMYNEVKRDNVFSLFVAKCKINANKLGVPIKSMVCIKQPTN